VRQLTSRGGLVNLRRLLAALLMASTVAVVAAVSLGAPVAQADDGVVAEWSSNRTLLGVAKNSWHWWGNCRARDFNGGSWGWYVRASTGINAPTFHIRHGMLQGYTASGGPVRIGCPTSEEFGWKGAVRQNFTNGFLYWQQGMTRAIAAVNGTGARLALERLGEVATPLTDTGRWSGWCLRFAYLANGRNNGSVMGNAIGEWREAVRTGKGHAADRNPPAGAVVYYEGGDDGHAGVYIGDGWVVSTAGYWWEAKPVRLHQIVPLPGLQYRGWAMPLK
jgi:hypothetical protein